jgi:hypothetical protein
MSTELETTTEDFIVKCHADARDTLRPNSMAKRSPKRWMLVARHIIEDGINVTAFLKSSGCTRNNYYDIRQFIQTSDDYEQIRSKAAIEAVTDYEIGADLERAYTEKMHIKMDEDELDIDAQGWAQIQRGQSMKLDRFQKLSGAATQRVIVEHKTTLDEAAEFARNAIKDAEIVDVETTED